MNQIPPERIWIPVWDLHSAMQALEFLMEYVLQFDDDASLSEQDKI